MTSPRSRAATSRGCSGDQAGLGYSFGAAYWVTPYLAAEGTYIQPADATATGTTDTFQFNSVFETQVLTIVGKVGIPLGPIRPYGQAGASYHQAKFTTNQTMTGGGNAEHAQLSASHDGWGFVFGGGVEMWFSSVFGVYGEFGSSAIKGSARDEADGVGRRPDDLRALRRPACASAGGSTPASAFALRASAAARLRRASSTARRAARFRRRASRSGEWGRCESSRTRATAGRRAGARRRPSCPGAPDPSPQSPDPTPSMNSKGSPPADVSKTGPFLSGRDSP